MKNFGIWACAFLLSGTVVGCGSNNGAIIEGETTEYPQVNEHTRSTSPSPLLSDGGRVTVEFLLIRRGNSYLTTAAAAPSFSVRSFANGVIVADQPLTFEKGFQDPDRPASELSGTYSASFTLPANTGPISKQYYVSIKVPRAVGSPWQNDVSTVAVPPAR